ncbi:hypothetical protein Tco_1016075 [Tanacetum coccineum]|uniref:Uncharacterized protein n=1 Tax=Tanacetum coccineum TaxID=301880 RepID=A0ABQ5FML3_9ASTR
MYKSKFLSAVTVVARVEVDEVESDLMDLHDAKDQIEDLQVYICILKAYQEPLNDVFKIFSKGSRVEMEKGEIKCDDGIGRSSRICWKLIVTMGFDMADVVDVPVVIVSRKAVGQSQKTVVHRLNRLLSAGQRNKSSDKERYRLEGYDAKADIGPTYDSDTVSQVPHDMLENMYAHGIQSHE